MHSVRNVFSARLVLAGALLSCGCVAQLSAPACERAMPAASDADIFACIDQLRPIADAIRIDGNGSDWAGVPSFTAPANTRMTDPSRRITKVSVLPRDEDLLVMLETAAAPSRVPFAFGLRVDLVGGESDDFMIDVALRGGSPLWTFDQDTVAGSAMPPLKSQVFHGLEVSIGAVVEIRVPYAKLIPLLPASTVALMNATPRRPWARVRSYTWDSVQADARVDGLAAASYTVAATPYTLDAPLHDGIVKAALDVTVPAKGQWAVAVSSSARTDSLPWYDCLYRTDYRFDSSDQDSVITPDQTLAWNQPILAPGNATVREVRTDAPDNPLYSPSSPGVDRPSNKVQLDLATPGFMLELYSMKQGSSQVMAGNTVVADQVIGAVGSSGNASEPLLCLALSQTVMDPPVSVPVGFSDVVVSLNPGADPWARHLASWNIHEGFLVQRAK